MRPIDKVIEAIKKITPREFDLRDEFFVLLDHIENNSHYTPPEVMRVRWSQLSETCEKILGDPNKESWKGRIAKLIMDEIDYREVLRVKDRILLINEDAKQKIKKLIEYAHGKPLSVEDIMNTATNKKDPVGNNLMHVLYLFDGFRVVYLEELQPPGLCRHLSVSIDTASGYPAPEFCNLILKEFGFRSTVEKSEGLFSMWLDKENEAVNFLETL